MNIGAYSFGSITINGETYAHDVLVFLERVKANWWRKEGHTLSIEDLDEVLSERPEFLIVGRV